MSHLPTYPTWTPVADRRTDVHGVDYWVWRLPPAERAAHDAAVEAGLVMIAQRRSAATGRFELLARSAEPLAKVPMRVVAGVRFG